MDISSEYSFPIFISSTDYDLIDLRSELARYLLELGYRPILSSADGFPDYTPSLEPWESCLPVLESCYVVVLVIDGRYGTPMSWPHFKDDFGDRHLSPTEAEYEFAHKRAKRMLVFVRRECLTYYASYRAALKDSGGDEATAKSILERSLPDRFDPDIFPFIQKVKTSHPIPWIKSFEDVTAIKQEIQLKLLNELAEVFRIKNEHLATVVHAFSRVMDTLSPEKRHEVLQSIGVTRDLIDDVQNRTDEIRALKGQAIEINEQLEKAQSDAREAKRSSQEKIELEKKATELEQEVKKLEERIRLDEKRNTRHIIGGTPAAVTATTGITDAFTTYNRATRIGAVDSYFDGKAGPSTFGSLANSYQIGSTLTCEQCRRQFYGISALANPLRRCPSCSRLLCDTCWPGSLTITTGSNKCPRCVKSSTG